MYWTFKVNSIFSSTLWGLGLALITYLGFLLRTILTVGSQKALGVGVLVEILVNPWYWAIVIVVVVLLLVWRLL